MNDRFKADPMDRKILTELQQNAARPINIIAAKVGLSVNACWRRIRRLEEEGIVRKQVALLDAHKLGVGMTVFVTVRAAEHSDDWLEQFAQAVASMPEIVEFHRLSGEIDYMIKILVSDVRHYDAVYKRLIRSVRLADVTASFSMECIKETTDIPLHVEW